MHRLLDAQVLQGYWQGMQARTSSEKLPSQTRQLVLSMQVVQLALQAWQDVPIR